jgi:hypothetical protein
MHTWPHFSHTLHPNQIVVLSSGIYIRSRFIFPNCKRYGACFKHKNNMWFIFFKKKKSTKTTMLTNGPGPKPHMHKMNNQLSASVQLIFGCVHAWMEKTQNISFTHSLAWNYLRHLSQFSSWDSLLFMQIGDYLVEPSIVKPISCSMFLRKSAA